MPRVCLSLAACRLRWTKAAQISLVFFAFDLLYLNGESTTHLPLIERKERLQGLFKRMMEIDGLR